MFINDGNIVLIPGEGKIVPVPGHKVTHKVVGADTDGAYSLLEVELVGDGPPQHIHKNTTVRLTTHGRAATDCSSISYDCFSLAAI